MVAITAKNPIRLLLVIIWVKSVSPIQDQTGTASERFKAILRFCAPSALSFAEATKKFDAVCRAVSLK